MSKRDDAHDARARYNDAAAEASRLKAEAERAEAEASDEENDGGSAAVEDYDATHGDEVPTSSAAPSNDPGASVE